MQFDYEKATQALNYLATLEGGEINKMKALKLIWLVERLHLRRYGKLIVNDEYLAMDFGPVASSVKDIAQLEAGFLSENEYSYASKYIKTSDGKLMVHSITEPDIDVFSDSEVNAFDEIYKIFGKYDQFKLADFSHHYPEWKKHEEMLSTGNVSRIEMSYNDFFEDPVSLKKDFFSEEKPQLQSAMEVFQESQEIDKIWN